MCNYQTLYHSSNGYVIRCAHCKGIQMAFGTSVVNLAPEEFFCFADMVVRLSDNSDPLCQEHEKSICLPLPADHVMMLLTPAEVKSLARMVLEVQALLEAYAILDAASPCSSED
ncbi:hypothetical protein HF329_29050 [Chitinophaga oryzae]|uniref:Uncharacterized protein n=1 Tax=Chitinophaga oryzae TaxID=2725414 RepID=A0AAE6ZPC8_9BACT|nr:DUF6686 family protein [Chitinophaga oryzae]QJB35135.1 hypothetical protein HF329_29050 [Chitinophaga oryzae]